MIKWIKKLFSRDNKTISDVILVDGLTAEGKPNDESIPWIKIEGMPDKKGQIKIEADWTSGLISCLREHYGYVGSSEDEIAHRFIAELHAQMMTEMQEDGNEFS